MRKIGNIVTDSRFGDDNLFNVVRSVDLAISGIPTLIVGWDKAKSVYPDLDILDWHIDGDVYWTFGKRERNWYYEDNVTRFRDVCLQHLTDSLEYVFFNILTVSGNEKYIFVGWIMNAGVKKYAYIKSDIAYIYVEGQKIVYGISLRDIEYATGSRERFMGMLRGTGSVEMVKPDMDSYGIRMLAQTRPYTVPYLMSAGR